MEELRISTITAIIQLCHPLDLVRLYRSIPISKYIPFIEYGNNPVKGYSKKLTKKKRKNKEKKTFFNQATIHVYHNKLVNVKLFNNGKLQITGLKYVEQPRELVEELIEYFTDFDMFDITENEDIEINDIRLVLINSDFSLPIEINREILHREIIDWGMYSSFEPCIYPGVNIKYYINTNNYDGICCCNSQCNGKGRADGDGDCKKVTIAVFKSGEVIITGAQNKKQLQTAHTFITEFVERS